MRSISVFLLGCLLAAAPTASAVTIGFGGSFTADDDVQLFYYHVATLGPVSITTTSFAGGGFSPILTLFDSTGLFQYEAYSSGEASISLWNSVADELYIVALTQWDNQAVASQTFGNLSEGFLRDGQGNFTGENSPTPGGSFLLPGPEQRAPFWSIEFTSADPTLVAFIPEPSSVSLGLSGGLMLAALAAVRGRRKRSNRAD